MKTSPFIFLCLIGTMLLSSSCLVTTIRGGEVGVRRVNGSIKPAPLTEGVTVYSPITTRVIKLPTRTTNTKVQLSIPSKEGLTIRSEMSILYRIEADKAPEILQNIGVDYEDGIILPVFRSALADVSSRFLAKDMHSGERAQIEQAVKDQMMDNLEGRGFIIEAVLMKRIELPERLSAAIESKLQAEQEAERMEFLLQREKKEAERIVIEAEGRKKIAIIDAQAEQESLLIRAEGQKQAAILEAEGLKEANTLINLGLTPQVLKYKSIDAFVELSKSENTKTIVTNGKAEILNVDR